MITSEVKYVEEHYNCVHTLHIEPNEDGITINTTSDVDNSQHDFSISKNDWELIKRIVDNY